MWLCAYCSYSISPSQTQFWDMMSLAKQWTDPEQKRCAHRVPPTGAQRVYKVSILYSGIGTVPEFQRGYLKRRCVYISALRVLFPKKRQIFRETAQQSEKEIPWKLSRSQRPFLSWNLFLQSPSPHCSNVRKRYTPDKSLSSSQVLWP